MFGAWNTNGHLRPVSNYICIMGRFEKTQIKNVIVFVNEKNEEDSQMPMKNSTCRMKQCFYCP